MNVVDLATLEGTRARPFAGEPLTVRLSLAAGESVPSHTHPGRTILCYVVEGRLDVRIDGVSTLVTAGELARFDGDRDVSPRAETDVTALLVLVETGD